MYRHKTTTIQKQNITLFKGKNGYDKVMKEMNEAPKEYDAIKALVEDASARSLVSIRDKKII